jgi:hypothetical protein
MEANVIAMSEAKPASARVQFSMDAYTADIFEPLVGQTFLFEGPLEGQGDQAGQARLELIDARKSGSGAPAAGFREPFTLIFALRSPEPLGNGLHRIAHDNFEPCDWFLNRVLLPGRDPRTAYYQAAFG